MARKSLWVRAVTLWLAMLPLAVPAYGIDRLERFRELATTRLGAAEASGASEARHELWTMLDDEIVENLSAGGVFASLPLLQDRLDQFSDAWGGASLRLSRAGEVLVGAFVLPGPPAQGTVRVYGDGPAPPHVLLALEREGRPKLHAPPATAAGEQLVVAWEGDATAHGSRALRIDLVRREHHAARVVWSLPGEADAPLRVTAWSARGAELRVRTELTYPGWMPGCADQTEQEDVYRVAKPPATVVRVAQRLHDGWHREARAAAARLFDALAARDARVLAALVPDPRLRARLPALTAAPVCDAVVGRPGEALLLGAAESDGRPWSVLLRRSQGGWRIAAAAPVLE